MSDQVNIVVNEDGGVEVNTNNQVGFWGGIFGNIQKQTDLQNALNAKADSSHTHDDKADQTDLDAVVEDVIDIKSAINDISKTTNNLFDGTFSGFTNMELVDEKVKNTNTDTRSYYLCIVRFRNNTTNVTVSNAKTFNTTGRKSITLTTTGSGDNIQVLHNGATRNLSFGIPFSFASGETYTISFDLEDYNVQSIGGLIISKIQIETGSEATEYISHTTAYDKVARKNVEQTFDKLDEISEHSPNLFNGTISSFSNLENDNGKIENTNTDTRESFYFTVRYLSNDTIIDSSTTTPIGFLGRVSQTLIATANCNAIQIMHNGRERNLSFIIPFTIRTGETYTVSLDVEGYDVTVVGGLILSDIQIELGDKETAYIPSEYTAVDYIARNTIDVRTPEAKLNVLLMGDSIFGNDGEIALFLDQMCNSCVNGAFGGTRVSVRPYTSDAFRFFDGVNIITALCTQTWTNQDSAATTLSSSYPWITSRLATLKAVDMSEINLLIMDWGTNDYTAGATIETITTAYGTVIDMLQETYPQLRILITTPIWRYWGTESDNENGDTKVYNVSTLKEIALAIESYMKDKRISVLNAYQNMPLSYNTALTYFDTDDKTHLNVVGNKVYAGLLHGKIRSIY